MYKVEKWLSSQLFSQKVEKGVSKERSHQSFTEINSRMNVQNWTGELELDGISRNK